jgi:VWFA-related protein
MSAAVLEKVQKAAGMFQPLITGERGCAALLSFSEHVSWLQDCTSDSAALTRAFGQLRVGEYARARMLDGATAAIAHLTKYPNSRRVLLLISESRDRGSESDLAEVTSSAQTAAVTVYAATYSALKTGFTSRTQVRQQEPKTPRPIIPNPNRTWNGAPPSPHNPVITAPEDRLDVLAGITELMRLRQIETTQVLTGGSGGRTFPFTRQQGLEGAIEKLGAELHSQYVLSFVPESSPGGYHTLDVRVVRSGELRVRVRPGYWRD